MTTHDQFLHRNHNKGKSQIKYSGSISLIQEPYFNARNFKVQGFSKDLKLFVGTNNSKLRACIVVSKNIDAWLINQFSNEDMVTIGIKQNNNINIYCSVYLPYDSPSPPPSDSLIKLVDHCRAKGWGIIIGSDANSWNQVWGSSDNNPRGTALLDWILGTQLHIVNKGNKPTFNDIRREQVIDITLCSNNIVDNIENWHVSNDVTLSDHNRIEFDFILEHADNSDDTYRNIKKTNWSTFKNELKENFQDSGSEDIDTMATELEEAIFKFYLIISNLLKLKKNKKPPWWNKDLTTLQKRVHSTRIKCNRYKTPENQEEHNSFKRDYKYKIRKAKEEGWQKFCTELEDLTSAARLQKTLKQGKKQMLGTYKKPDGSYTETPEETLKLLLDTHFPDSEVNIDHIPRTYEPSNLDVNKVINTQSVKAAFKSFKPYKSCGPDGIYPAMLQQGIDTIVQKVVSIYRKSLQTGIIPKAWLKVKIVFISKPGKVDFSDPKSVRPISLTSFLLKGLERIIFWHLNKTTFKYNKLHQNLFSYQEGKGTEDALHSLVHKVEKALEKKEFAVALFLDIDAAFSKASIESILKNMERKGIDPGIVRWSEYMLVHRECFATLNGETVMKVPTRGTPQGGILSIIFWNLEPDDLLDRFPQVHPSLINCFADDIVDIISGIDMSTIECRLRQDIKILEKWATDSGLSFSGQKTKVMVFTLKRKYRNPILFLQGEQIEVVQHFKYLGVTLDSKLTWCKHVENITNKATKTLAMCRSTIGRNWGLKPKVCRWIYISLIRPILSYASVVWLKVAIEKSKFCKLEKVQRQGCRLTLSAMCTTGSESMETILDIRPIEIHLKEVALKSYIRLVRNGNWKHKPGETHSKYNHSVIVTELSKEIQDISMPTDKLLLKERETCDFNTIIKSRTEMESIKVHMKPRTPNTINVFTDGSKTGAGSGYGYICKGTTDIKAQNFDHLGKLATVFQAELSALEQAAAKLIQLNISDNTINFFVDSQAAIMAVSNFTVVNKSVLNAKKALNILSKDNIVNVNWIPSHVGHLGNEVADRLAKLGSYGGDSHRTRPEPYLPVSLTYINSTIKEWGLREHQKKWRTRKKKSDCRQTKMMLPSIRNKAWNFIQNWTRRDVMYITQILTGHACVNKHLKEMGFADTKACEHCNDPIESIEHILGDCPKYNQIRVNIFGNNIILAKHFWELNLRDLVKFFKKTKRFSYFE